MALDLIDIGTAADDGTGDDLRTSFIKTNLAITEIENKMPVLDKDNPSLEMHVSTTGLAAQMQVIDDETGHLVATMEWHKASQEFIFSLFDKNTGALKSGFSAMPDGTVRNPTWESSLPVFPDTLVTADLLDMALYTKAEKTYVDNAIINTYTGTTVPVDTFGKEGDKYHKYATDTLSDIITGTSFESYSDTYIELLYNSTATGIKSVGIDPAADDLRPGSSNPRAGYAGSHRLFWNTYVCVVQ
jgi:hypothetical protein